MALAPEHDKLPKLAEGKEVLKKIAATLLEASLLTVHSLEYTECRDRARCIGKACLCTPFVHTYTRTFGRRGRRYDTYVLFLLVVSL